MAASEGADALAVVASRFALAPDAVARLSTLVELVSNDPQAPTTIRAPAAVVDDHVADSLVALELEAVQRARSVADLGSGAGFPGLALAIALPAVGLTLVESSGRKCAFLARAITECAIPNVEVVHARAESFPLGWARYDLVTARALASLEVTAEYAAPLLSIGGSLVAWRGRRDAAAEAIVAKAAVELGLKAPHVYAARPYPSAANRHLYVMEKVADTPARFPRRPGVATKRPLGHRRSSDRAQR